MASRRLEQLNEQFRYEISELIQRKLRDPGLAGVVSITAVDITPDLRHARVYFSVLGDETKREQVLAALQRAAGFLRHELATRLRLRHIPELAFRPDISIERGERIMELLREVHSQAGSTDEASPKAGDDATPPPSAGEPD